MYRVEREAAREAEGAARKAKRELNAFQAIGCVPDELPVPFEPLIRLMSPTISDVLLYTIANDLP